MTLAPAVRTLLVSYEVEGASIITRMRLNHRVPASSSQIALTGASKEPVPQ